MVFAPVWLWGWIINKTNEYKAAIKKSKEETERLELDLQKRINQSNIENLLPYKNFVMKMISRAHGADYTEGGAEKFLQEFIVEYENIK